MTNQLNVLIINLLFKHKITTIILRIPNSYIYNQLMWVPCGWDVHRAKSVASNITVFVQLKLYVFTVII